MIKFGIIYPSSRNKSCDDTFSLAQRLLQQKNRKKSLSYGGTVEFEINTEELFVINDLKEN